MRASRVVRSIALPVLFLGLSAPAHGAVYGGTSGNNNAFVLTTGARTLTGGALWVDAKCDNGTALTYNGPIDFAARPPAAPKEDENVLSGNRIGPSGRFTAKGGSTADYGDNVGTVTETLTGRVTRTSARGTIEMTVVVTSRATQQPVATCSSGKVNWRARSAPRRIFGGITSFGSPVVAVLRADRRSVKDLYIGWTADCQPPGQFGLGDALVNFPLSRTGRFGDTFEGRFPIEDGGGERTFDYALRGRVRGSRLTGSLSVTVTDRNPDGAVTSTCKRGKHSFTATSTR
jgi:hypothetical protein